VGEGVDSKLLLAFEVPVDPPFLQPRRSHEIGEGGAAISLPIEDWGRFANDFLPRLVAFAHVATLLEVIQHSLIKALGSIPMSYRNRSRD
jgi:hypothetical protein